MPRKRQIYRGREGKFLELMQAAEKNKARTISLFPTWMGCWLHATSGYVFHACMKQLDLYFSF